MPRMKISIAVGISPDDKYDTYGELYDAGFRHIDCHFDFGTELSASTDAGKVDRLTEYIAKSAQKHGLDFTMAHAPYKFNPCDSEDHFRVQVEEIKHTLRACHALGIDRVTVHAGYGRHNKDYAEMLATNVKYFSAILEEAEKYGITLMLENISELIYKQPFVLETAENILTLIDMLGNHPLIGVCWDTGHANTLALDQYANIKALGGRLCGLHLHDNFGENDDHMTPLYGNVNFDDVMKGLEDIGYTGPFNFETKMFRGGKEWPNYRRPFNSTSGARDVLFAPSHELTVYGYGVMYHMAEYILERCGVEIE